MQLFFKTSIYKAAAALLLFTCYFFNAEAAAPAVPLLSNSGSSTLCEGDSRILTATPTGGGSYSGITFTWKKNGQVITGQSSATLTVTVAGSYTVNAANAEVETVGLC